MFSSNFSFHTSVSLQIPIPIAWIFPLLIQYLYNHFLLSTFSFSLPPSSFHLSLTPVHTSITHPLIASRLELHKRRGMESWSALAKKDFHFALFYFFFKKPLLLMEGVELWHFWGTPMTSETTKLVGLVVTLAIFQSLVLTQFIKQLRPSSLKPMASDQS